MNSREDTEVLETPDIPELIITPQIMPKAHVLELEWLFGLTKFTHYDACSFFQI